MLLVYYTYCNWLRCIAQNKGYLPTYLIADLIIIMKIYIVHTHDTSRSNSVCATSVTSIKIDISSVISVLFVFDQS